ncbi:MAG TPA: hypothetical protein VIU37_05675 [Candidatus Limnocylindrales bacterium]
MSTSMLPAVIDALYTTMVAALPNAKVTDGFGVAADPTVDALMIGVDDADNPGASATADNSQEMANAGLPRDRDETGVIQCVAFSLDGGKDPKTARDRAYAVFGAVETSLRTDPRIGLTAPALLVAEIGSHRLLQDQFNQGAGAWVLFTVKYTARI